MVIQFILLILAAYLIGSIPTAYVIAKWRRGIDIRRYGSGNVGASNVMEMVSKGWSIAVSIFDVGKGALMVWLAQLFGLSVAQQAVIGIASIIGHNWTVFLHFQGGRGIATSMGVVAVLAPRIGLLAIVFTCLLVPFHLLSLGVTISAIALPITSWFFSQPLGVKEPVPVTLGFMAILLIILFRRLTAPKSPLSATVSKGELILYRLLFDRDIRDRKTWISQTRGERADK